MPQLRIALLAVGLAWLAPLLVTLGCNKRPPPPPPPTPAGPAAPIRIVSPPAPPLPPLTPEESPPAAPSDNSKQPAEGSSAPASAKEKEAKAESNAKLPAPDANNSAVAQAVAIHRERFLLLTPKSPFIVEVEIRIDGKDPAEMLQEVVQTVLKEADTDGDGRATWKELTESQKFKYGQFGNVAINDDNGKKQVIDMYDRNKNGTVDRDEVPRFVTRNAGGARPFSVRGTADLRDVGARETRLWQLLQIDDDATSLSMDELAAAAGRLRSRDTDDDDVLLPGDLVDDVALMPGEMPAGRRSRGPDAAKLLGDAADWAMIRVNLDEQYALGGELSPASFPLIPRLFEELDADKSGRILRQEYPNLDKATPHIKLAVDFDVPAASDQPPAAAPSAQPLPPRLPQVSLVSLCPELEAIKRGAITQPGRLLVQLGDLSLMFYTNDLVGGGDYEARAKQVLESLDKDKNGYLEASEVPEEAQAQLARIEAVDTDADGKVYAGEIVAFLAQQQAALRSQVHAKAGDRDDPLFAALDANGDDRLDGREIEGALDRLKALDASGDGKISAEEIPAAMFVGFARGNIENPDALFAPPAVASRTPAADAPRWFTAMDTSRDGLISRREFLGTLEQFAQLDANQDGFVDAAEAAQAAPAPTTSSAASM